MRRGGGGRNAHQNGAEPVRSRKVLALLKETPPIGGVCSEHIFARRGVELAAGHVGMRVMSAVRLTVSAERRTAGRIAARESTAAVEAVKAALKYL